MAGRVRVCVCFILACVRVFCLCAWACACVYVLSLCRVCVCACVYVRVCMYASACVQSHVGGHVRLLHVHIGCAQVGVCMCAHAVWVEG